MAEATEKRLLEDADEVVEKKRVKTRPNGDAAGTSVGATVSSEQEVDDSESAETFFMEGSKFKGTLLLCGGANWDMVGKKDTAKGKGSKGAKANGARKGRNLWGPHRLVGFSEKNVRTVVSGPTAGHSVIISEGGDAMTFGRNNCGQLGHGNTERVDIPSIPSALNGINIVDAACGRHHTLFLTEEGKVYACGANKLAQLGIGSQNIQVTKPNMTKHYGPPICKVACGSDFSMIADIRGNVYSFGCPEYGQTGHNSDGKYFVTANKLGFHCQVTPQKLSVFLDKDDKKGSTIPVTDVHITDIACGANHTLALDSKHRVFSWGFGGYGRLGHSTPKDEMVPRQINYFDGPKRGAVRIFAGSTYSMAINIHGTLLFWGQASMTGEANMYPKPVQDLYGWLVRSVGTCHKSIVVAADQSVISWGTGGTCGELGYGEKSMTKSSSTPKEVNPLKGIYIHAVSCGYTHTLFIARNDKEGEMEKIKQLPEYCP